MILPDGFKSFKGESDGHEDGAAENDVVDGVEEVAECVRVKRRRPEVTPVRFDHAKHDELRKENSQINCFSRLTILIILTETGGHLTKIHLIEIVFFQLIESFIIS